MRKMWAIVTKVNGNTIQVRFDNGQESIKYYRYPKGCIPIVGDRALFFDDICIGIY